MRFLIDEHMGPSAARWLVSSWFDFSSLPHVRDVPIGIQVWRLERALGVGEGGFSVANLGSTNVGPLRGRPNRFRQATRGNWTLRAAHPLKANLVVFFITTACPYSVYCPPQPGARGKRRSRSKNGIALWGQPLGMQVKRNDRCSKRLKPIKRRRLPRSGRAKERPFFGSFFGRAKKEQTPRPGAKTQFYQR